MPKMKPHSGMKKRVRVTGGGKLLAEPAGKRHKLEGKSPKRRRKLRKATMVSKADQPRLKRLVPYL